MQELRSENPAMTFDEVSMERSKSFVKALQELKNLRPQLYSAAEYCEKSYLHSELKQMVLENLKDYAVRALVNAVDHLGAVAYKLTDLFDQQTSDISTMELKVSSLNQKFLACKTYVDKEGLRQQKMLTFMPRHHKHYILPNTVNKRVHFSPQIQTDGRQIHIQSGSRIHPSGTPASNTLSWHLASETKPSFNGTPNVSVSSGDIKSLGTTDGIFHVMDAKEAVLSKSAADHFQLASGCPASGAVLKTFGVTQKGSSQGSKPMTPFRSFDNQKHRQIVRAPVRSKSLFSFFVKQKPPKPKTKH